MVNKSKRKFLQHAKKAGIWALGTVAAAELTGISNLTKGKLADTYTCVTDPASCIDFPPEFDEMDVERLRLIGSLIYDRGSELSVVGGRAHHLYPGTVHPDDQWAVSSLARIAKPLGKTAHETDRPLQASLEGGFVCTGSPVSNAWTRRFMEYDYLDSSKPSLGLVRRDSPSLILPLEYVLNTAELHEERAGRHSSETDKVVPNWSVRGGGQQFIPDEETDFLMITRIPQMLDPTADETGEFRNGVTILSGCHGFGTAAVRLLFQDLVLLKRLQKVADRSEYWQALIKVNKAAIEVHPVTKTPRPIAWSLADDLVASSSVQVVRTGIFSGA